MLKIVKDHFRISQSGFNQVFCLLAAIAFVCLFADTAFSGPKQGKEKIKAVIIGDRLVDMAYNLGVVPEAMVARCIWPAMAGKVSTVKSLGCPRSIVTKRKGDVVRYAEEKGIKWILIEKSEDFCILAPDADPMNIALQLKDKGFKLDFVDFSQGLEPALVQAGKLLSKEAEADKLIKSYRSLLEKTKKKMPQKKLGKKVLVLHGIARGKTGKFFIQAEAPDGYSDRFFINPLGCVNVAGLIEHKGVKVTKGYFTIRKIAEIIEAKPDVIIITGKSLPVQKAINKAAKNNKALFEIPAVKNREIYSLPLYIDSEVIEYPYMLLLWLSALS